MKETKYITVRKFAESLGFSPSYIYRQIRDNKKKNTPVSFTYEYISGVCFIVQ